MGLSIGLGSNVGAGAGTGSGGGSGTGGGSGAGGAISAFDIPGAYIYSNVTLRNAGLVNAPLISLKNVTTIGQMFYECGSLESIEGFVDTESVTTCNMTFDGCKSLKSVPVFSFPKATNLDSFLNVCKLIEYAEIDAPVSERVPSMFYYCISLKKAKLKLGVITDAQGMFNNCSNLEEVEGEIIFGDMPSDNYAMYVFHYCTLLRSFKIKGLSTSFDIRYCPSINKESILYLFNNAKTGVSGKTITLHADVFNQLTTDEVAIATEKGFTVASA